MKVVVCAKTRRLPSTTDKIFEQARVKHLKVPIFHFFHDAWKLFFAQDLKRLLAQNAEACHPTGSIRDQCCGEHGQRGRQNRE